MPLELQIVVFALKYVWSTSSAAILQILYSPLQ